MVVDGRHLEDAFTLRSLEIPHLERHGTGLHDEQETHDYQQQFRAGHDRQSRESRTDGHGAGIAHEDPSGSGVPPQETEAGAGECR